MRTSMFSPVVNLPSFRWVMRPLIEYLPAIGGHGLSTGPQLPAVGMQVFVGSSRSVAAPRLGDWSGSPPHWPPTILGVLGSHGIWLNATLAVQTSAPVSLFWSICVPSPQVTLEQPAWVSERRRQAA